MFAYHRQSNPLMIAGVSVAAGIFLTGALSRPAPVAAPVYITPPASLAAPVAPVVAPVAPLAAPAPVTAPVRTVTHVKTIVRHVTVKEKPAPRKRTVVVAAPALTSYYFVPSRCTCSF
jgi:hypothetical protein